METKYESTDHPMVGHDIILCGAVRRILLPSAKEKAPLSLYISIDLSVTI